MKTIKILVITSLLSFSVHANKQIPDPQFFKAMESDKALWAELDKGLFNSIVDIVGCALSIAEDVALSLLNPIQNLIKDTQPAIVNNPYKNIKAYVRRGEPICDLEMDFRNKRFYWVKEAQEGMLGIPLDDEDVLEIACSFSGGGWRAMCWALGACGGAKKIGLFDSTMYTSSLSGSTWCFGPLLSTGLGLEEYRDRLLDVARNGIDLRGFADIAPMIDNFWVKFAYNQPMGIVDPYGALLANALLRNLDKNPHEIYLSNQRAMLENGSLPMPVYTATLGEREKLEFWFEFTPYEVGSRWLSAYVPSWAFGRHFKNGVSVDDAPELSFGFLMGTFGSAFAADFEDVYDIIFDRIEFPSFLQGIPFAETIFYAVKQVFSRLAYSSDIGDIRIAYSRVSNFVYKMDGVAHNDYKNLRLVDAGLDFNNPVFATYRKPPYGDAPDIIFIFDASSALDYRDIAKIIDYAKYNGLKFPEIEEFEVGKQIMTVFKDDDDLEVPVVVYMPRVNGINMVQRHHYKFWYDYYLEVLEGFDLEKAIASGFANTYNFNYTYRQAEQLVAAAEFNLLAVSDKVKEVMRDRIEAKRRMRRKSVEE